MHILLAINLMEIQTCPDLKNLLSSFQALSDPLRLRVVELLLRCQELCVCEIREQLNVSPSKLSFHLKILKQANLLSYHQEGHWIYYSLNASQFIVLQKYLDEYNGFSTTVCED